MLTNISSSFKNILFIILFLLPISMDVSGQAYGEFPFQESFLSGQPVTGVVFPNPVGTTIRNQARYTGSGLQLTADTLGRFGAVYLDNHRFRSKLGIFIEFEYMIFDGNGGDGLSVFFFDADEPNPGIGAIGAGIGYTYNRAINSASSKRSPGIKGAYMGIAFDSFGNFKSMRYQGESRVTGIPYSFGATGSSVIRQNKPNNVTIRGAMRTKPIKTGGYEETGQEIFGMGVGYCGYPVLITRYTNDLDGYILQESGTCAYDILDRPANSNLFEIRGGTKFEKSTDPGYRKAFIEMFPNGDEGFYVSVMIQHGTVKDTIIYDYNYRKEFDYLENAISPGGQGDNNSDAQPQLTSLKRKLEVPLPINLKIGFAAATGEGSQGRRDRHIIKNVGIRLPRSAEAYDDYAPNQYSGVRSVNFSPLLNDIGYTGLISRTQVGSSEHIDGTTFRFINKDGTPVNGFEVEVDGEGTWTYDVATEIVTFRPLRTFIGKARIKYDIKGGKTEPDPYADEAYRSLPATIGVDIEENPNPTRNIISNKMTTIKLK